MVGGVINAVEEKVYVEINDIQVLSAWEEVREIFAVGGAGYTERQGKPKEKVKTVHENGFGREREERPFFYSSTFFFRLN